MNFVIYFARSLAHKDTGHLFEDTTKWPIYRHFFQKLQASGFSVYLASFTDNFVKEDLFENPRIFNGESFEDFTGTVRADVLFDRSYSSHLPSTQLLPKTFNLPSFKQLCGDKITTHKLLGGFMPMNETLDGKSNLEQKLLTLSPDILYVIKPSRGIRGAGIFIDTPEKLLKGLPKTGYPYLLQEFINTQSGIPGITDSTHDLRFVSVNGSILLVALRTPAPGSLLANVAKGGSIKELPLSAVPNDILTTVQYIHSQIESHYPKGCYSMDFGYDADRKKVFLFELNDRIGFPRPGMPNAYRFAEELAESILRFSQTLS